MAMSWLSLLKLAATLSAGCLNASPLAAARDMHQAGAVASQNPLVFAMVAFNCSVWCGTRKPAAAARQERSQPTDSCYRTPSPHRCTSSVWWLSAAQSGATPTPLVAANLVRGPQELACLTLSPQI